MSTLFPETEDDFEAAREAGEDEALILDIGGWEGPLHMLLALARKNKVDLTAISMVELADQYLDFVHAARQRRLDLAAEYLVMAAWLAYLKSRLLLPKPRPQDDEPEPELMAAALAFRLARLEAMRAGAKALYARALFKRDVFPCGQPEGVRSIRTPLYEAELYDLLKAYAARRERGAFATYQPAAPRVYSLEQARKRLTGVLTRLTGWEEFGKLLPEEAEADGPSGASITASSLLAALEITKDGDADMRQDGPFAPIWMRPASREKRS
ncbi:segregation/condensation protein A [Alkalicaulis satelles]|uniref:Segregation and condensation protein A n=1 Tax=Alkalicaulis satelles TaxID=2609175 RepID=A0A5M6ZKL7_9PROT|nr:ScpA family protein [Alkalicaulis satelles]KAA5805376.1 segregation/condensation protein A [Alkalicaulis satelles]